MPRSRKSTLLRKWPLWWLNLTSNQLSSMS
jgi:hypothetical protein